ncbi:hypothetical protein, partial [Pseudomonas syringae]|uniref:hypothetical protein n=1 Tax=Pseudomonas syringae TaxID=317 RepID=UPI0034D42621
MDIRETLEAAYSDEKQAPESPTVASPEPEVTTDKPVDRARDEIGRFAAKEVQAEPLPEPVADVPV